MRDTWLDSKGGAVWGVEKSMAWMMCEYCMCADQD